MRERKEREEERRQMRKEVLKKRKGKGKTIRGKED